MTCLTHLVECLKNKGVEAEAYASSCESSSRGPSNALICDTSNDFIHAKKNESPQWWSANFKQKVSLKGYTIKTNVPKSSSSSLYNWTLSVSFDNTTWKVAHGPLCSYESERTYNFTNPINATFVRIDGTSLSSIPNHFYLWYVKFYGSLNPTMERGAATCKTRKGMNLNLMRMIFILCSC